MVKKGARGIEAIVTLLGRRLRGLEKAMALADYDRDFYPFPLTFTGHFCCYGSHGQQFTPEEHGCWKSPTAAAGHPAQVTGSPCFFTPLRDHNVSYSLFSTPPNSPGITLPHATSPGVPATPPNSAQVSPKDPTNLFHPVPVNLYVKTENKKMPATQSSVRKQLSFDHENQAANLGEPSSNTPQINGTYARRDSVTKGKRPVGQQRFYAPRMIRRFNEEMEAGIPLCSFCRKNGETRVFYLGHRLRNDHGILECPILRSYICPHCSATGDNAHTESYCPVRPDGAHSFAKVQVRRNAVGKRL